MVVAKYSKNQDLAFALVKMLTSTENQVTYTKTFGDLPTNADAAKQIEQGNDAARPDPRRRDQGVGTPFSGAWGDTQLALVNVVVQSIPALSGGGVSSSDLEAKLKAAQADGAGLAEQGQVAGRDDMSDQTLTAPERAVAGTAGPPAGRGPAGGRRRALERRSRPLWMLLPGGILMLVIIVVPLIVAVVMSTLDLDQYTLQSWLQAPFIGARQLCRGAHRVAAAAVHRHQRRRSPLHRRAWSPCRSASPRRSPRRTRSAGRALVRSLFLIPYVLPAFVVGTLWRTMLQPGGVVDRCSARSASTAGSG